MGVSSSTSVTIGSGGGAHAAGGNSVFSTLTATGGGFGGTYSGVGTYENGGSGGSGGGGSCGYPSTPGSGGAPASGQGNGGGTGSVAGNPGGGGGGGKSASGNSASGANGGKGGDGTDYSSYFGTVVGYVGGGGGGAARGDGVLGSGGLGGGGNGGNQTTAAISGTANTGGGGGGGAIGVNGAGGGSGIVVLRYSGSLSPYSQYISSTLDFGSSVEGATLSWISSGVNTGDGETPYSTTGMVAQWDFNETSGITAVSGGTCGTSCNGTLTNMTTSGQDAATMTGWTSNNRRWGAGALMFDGSNDYVSCTDANCGGTGKLDAMSGSLSIEFWAKPTTCSTSSVSPGIIDKFDTSTSKGYLIYNEYYSGANVWTFYDPVNNSYARSTTTCSPGSWTHIVAVYDSIGTSKKMYVNGRLEATLTGQNPLGDSGSDFNIGRYRNSSYYYSGIIDSPRIYSRALSADEILSNYQSGNIEFQYRVSTDGNTWSDWISDGVSTSDTSWKTYDDQYLYNPSSTGLVTYWAMDESSTGTAYDVSTIHHASASGTTVVNGKYGNARYFNGSSDYLRASPSIDNPLKTGSFTLSGWFNANSFTNYMTLLQRGIVSSGGQYFGMGLYATSSAIYFVRNVGAAQSQISYSYTFATSTWYHAAATYNDSTGAVALYLNGALVASGTLSTNDVAYNGSYDVGYTIGAMRRNISDSYGNQTLDEILIFNTVLTASDITNLYITGLGSLGVYQQKAVGAYQEGITDTYLYSSSESGQTSYWPMENPSGTTVSDIVGSNSGTASGTSVVSGRYGNSRSFNGSSDYVTIPNTIDTPIKTGSFTLSSWFKASSFSTNMTIFQRGIVSSMGLYYGMGLYASSSTITFARNVASSSAQISYTYNFLTNVWYHVAATYNDSTGAVAIYLNGIPVSTGTLSTNDVAYHASYDLGYSVGAMRRNISDSYSNGIIDELRIFNTVRSASDIEDEYDRGMEISHIEGGIRTEGVSSSRITNSLGNGLVSYWKLDESSGTSLSDSVGSNTGTATGTSVVTGKYSNARSFNGSSDYIGVSSPSNIPISNTTYTIEAWIYPIATGTRGIVGWGNYGSTNQVNALRLNSTNQITNYWWGNDLTVTVGTITTSVWHHVVATFDGTTRKIYYDGNLAGSGAASGNAVPNANNFRIGSTNNGEYFSGYLDEVKIYNIAKTADEILEEYNATSTYYTNYTVDSNDLSDDNTITVDIAGDKVGTYSSLIWGESAYANYQTDSNTVGLWHLDEISGSGAYLMDSSGRGNNGTPTGTTYSNSGKVAGARYFNGTSDYISTPITAAQSTITFEAWIKTTDITYSRDGTGIQVIAGKWASGNKSFVFSIANGTGILSVTISPGGDNNGTSHNSTFALSNNVWAHVGFSYDDISNTVIIYKDGLSESFTNTQTMGGTTALQIGRITWGNATDRNWIGIIDEARVSNIARTPDQIRQAYEIGLRTHNVTVDFGATLNSSNLIANSSDTSFTIDATTQGLDEMGSNLYVEDKIIVREVSSGTEYIAQGSVSSITELTGATEVSSWDSESTFPSGGFTTKASVFKWQREYIPVKNRTIGTQVDATSLLTLRLTSAFGGRNIWIDNLRTSDGHLANSSGEELIFPYEAQYFQYKALIMSQDTAVTPYISQVQVDYEGGGPTLEQLMRHGQWFDSGGAKKGYWWVGTH